MEGREGKRQLRFDTSGTDDPAPVATPRGEVQKGRLSHAGLPTQNERAALASAHRAQQLIEPCTLARAATEHRRRLAADLNVAHCDLLRSQGSNKPPRANPSPEWKNRGLLPNGG